MRLWEEGLEIFTFRIKKLKTLWKLPGTINTKKLINYDVNKAHEFIYGNIFFLFFTCAWVPIKYAT